jgi:hypothetical protein
LGAEVGKLNPSKSDEEMSNAEVEEKFTVCTEGMLTPAQQKTLISDIWSICSMDNCTHLLDILGKVEAQAQQVRLIQK